AYSELDREARGINQIFAKNQKPPKSNELEQASGDTVFYVQRAKGIDPYPGPTPAFTLLPKTVLDFRRILAGEAVQFEFTRRVKGTATRMLAVARPVRLGGEVFGATILARPKTRLNQGVLPLVWRLLPAFFAG